MKTWYWQSLPLLLALATATTPGRACGQHGLSLAEAIATAQRNRSEMSQAELEVERARLQSLSAWLQLIQFRLQATGSYGYQNTAGLPPFACAESDLCRPEQRQFNASASVTIPIWSGLQVESNILRARRTQLAVRADQKALVRRLTLEVATAYWSVKRAQMLIDLATRALNRGREIATMVKARVDAGISPPLDFNRTRELILSQEIQLNSLQNQFAAALASLAFILQIERPAWLTDDPAQVGLSLPTLQAAEEAALCARPELAAAAYRIQAQDFAVRAAKGAYWPQLALVGEAVGQNQVFFATTAVGQPLRDERVTFGLSVALNASWNVFDTLTTWTAVRTAALDRERLSADRERLSHQIVEEVRIAHSKLAHALDRRVLVMEAARTAQQDLEFLKKRYAVGSAILLEVLTGENQLIQFESELVDTETTIAEANAELRAAMSE